MTLLRHPPRGALHGVVPALLLLFSACTAATVPVTSETTDASWDRESTSTTSGDQDLDHSVSDIVTRGEQMCFGEPADTQPNDQEAADAVMMGDLKLGSHASMRIPDDPTWAENPFDNASWLFRYQSLTWVDVLRRSNGGDHSTAMHARYRDLLMDWWRDNQAVIEPTTSANATDDYRWFDMSTAYRGLMYLCAVPEIGPEQWLLDALSTHGAVLADDTAYAGGGNHALHQDMALLAIGYTLDQPDWIEKATERATALLTTAIDAQGVSLEGSASYQLANFVWWEESRTRLEIVGTDLGSEWDRLDEMPNVMGHFIAPDGRWALIGDSEFRPVGSIAETPFDYARSQGDVGAPPEDTVVALDAGYVFARNTWSYEEDGSSMNFVGLRFGPPMKGQAHAHEDLGSVVFYSGNDRLIDDTGLYAYFGGEDRKHLVSQAAHNVIRIEDADYYRSAVAELTAFEHEQDWVFANVSTGAIAGARWSRTLIAVLDAGIVIVDDRISQKESRTIIQQWHLQHAAKPVVHDATVSVPRNTGGPLVFHFLDEPPPSIDVESGIRSLRYGEVETVPVVQASHSDSARFTTVISLDEVATELVWRSSKGFRIRVQTPGEIIDIAVNNASTGEGLQITRSDR